MFIEVPLFQETSPAPKCSWLRICYYIFLIVLYVWLWYELCVDKKEEKNAKFEEKIRECKFTNNHENKISVYRFP